MKMTKDKPAPKKKKKAAKNKRPRKKLTAPPPPKRTGNLTHASTVSILTQETRRVRACELYLTGEFTLQQIGDELGVSKTTVHDDIKVSKQVLRDAQAASMELWQIEAVARYEAIYRTARREFDRSCLDHVTTTVEQMTRTKKNGTRVQLPGKATQRTEGQAGSANLLRIMQECLRAIREIRGIDAPKRTELTGADGGPLEVKAVSTKTDAELEADIKEVTAEIVELEKKEGNGHGNATDSG